VLRIDRDSDAPPGLVQPVLVAMPGCDQSFDLRAVEVGAHHAHAFSIAPIELATGLVEMNLLRCVRDALRDDDHAVLAIQVDAFDRAVMEADRTHVGPVDLTGIHVHDDAVGEAAIRDDRLEVGSVGIDRVNAATAQFEEKQSAGAGRVRGNIRSADSGQGHRVSFRVIAIGRETECRARLCTAG
jgi:hypothetical protein